MSEQQSDTGSSPPTVDPVDAWCAVTLLPGPAGEIAVLRVAGEIDLLTIGILQGGLDAGLARGPCHLVVDLSGVTFCGVRGLGVLAHAHDAAAAQGVGFTVSAASRSVVWMWATGWPATPLPMLYRDVAAAVRSARAPSSRPHRGAAMTVAPAPPPPRRLPLPPQLTPS